MGSIAILNGRYGDIVEFPDFVYRQSDPYTSELFESYDFTIPPLPTEMEPLMLPPSPPSSTTHKRLKFKSVITYWGAIYRGDILLCLPRHIRNLIFSYLLADFPELRYLEVPDTKDFTYPSFAQFNDLWYTETCELMIQRATFSIGSDAAVFSLMVFLNEFQESQGYDRVTSLEFGDLSIFEKGDFSSNATKLLCRCRNLKNMSLVVNMDDLIWKYGRGAPEVDINAMVHKYDLLAITRLETLEVVTLSLQPFMALKKRLMTMELKKLEVEQKGYVVSGLDGFWGLKEWLEFQALDHMRLINVVCPRID